MNFDAGSWWIFGIISAALIAAVTYLIKRSLFERVDKCEKSVDTIKEKYTLKADHEQDITDCKTDITKIRETYATKTDLKDLKVEIKADLQQLMNDVTDIKKNSLLREDFFRAQVSNEQSFQKLFDLFYQNGGGGKNG